MAGPGYTTAAAVGTEHARAVWALAARERLLEAAGEYHAVVEQAELARFVQERSLVRSTGSGHTWMGDVLRRVAEACVSQGEPLLSALCVNHQGSVGAVYASLVEEFRGERPADPDDHAAGERLECYRWFGAELPAGGGEPALAPQLQARRDRRAAADRPDAARVPGVRRAAGDRPPRPAAVPRTSARKPARAAEEEAPLVLCPVHFTVLPATGVCDLCE